MFFILTVLYIYIYYFDILLGHVVFRASLVFLTPVDRTYTSVDPIIVYVSDRRGDRHGPRNDAAISIRETDV